MAFGGTLIAPRRWKAGLMGSSRARGALATLALASVVLVAVIAAGNISMQPLLPPTSPNTPTSQTQDSRQVIVVRPPSDRPGEDEGDTGDREVAGDEELIPVPDVLIPLDPILRPVPPVDDPGGPGGPGGPVDVPTDPGANPTEPTVDPTDPVVDPDPTPTPPPRGGNGGVIPEPSKGNVKPPKAPKPKDEKPVVIPAQPAIPGVRAAIPSSRAAAKAQRSTSKARSSSPVVVIRTPQGGSHGQGAKAHPAKRLVHHSSARDRAPKRSGGDSDNRREKHKATKSRGRGHRRGHRRRPRVED
jgi:hypothetical protein